MFQVKRMRRRFEKETGSQQESHRRCFSAVADNDPVPERAGKRERPKPADIRSSSNQMFT